MCRPSHCEEVLRSLTLQNVSSGGGFRLGRKSLLAALRESLKRMGQERVDLYQVHGVDVHAAFVAGPTFPSFVLLCESRWKDSST